ncbi:MAG TPA: PilN domain-containing protein [Gammaproteobacteria bacterium]|nr:PilN domain-containing protein [Gammaproteobacteria bacterium]
MIFLTRLTFGNMIEDQNERNDLLKSEIAGLDKQITEINGLENQKERLLARMEIIERLQQSRPEIVHLFDELARTLPDGVYLTSVKQSGRNLEIAGSAESSTRVSTYMRNIDASDWLTDPGLIKVETQERERGRNAQFAVTARQVGEAADAESGTGKAAK